MQQNNNRENRSFKIITAIALCVAVLCLSVAYATLSASLKISGTATVEKANWQIELEKAGTGYETAGTATVNTYTLTENSTTVSDLEVTLKKPGDKATITLNAVNKGDIAAELTSITKLGVSCEGTGAFAEDDAQLICGTDGDGSNGNLDFSVTYGGDDVTAGTLPTDKKLPATTGTKPINIVIEYNVTKTTKLPADEVTVTLSDLAFVYGQDTTAK